MKVAQSMKSKKKGHYILNVFLKLLRAENSQQNVVKCGCCLLTQAPGLGSNNHQNACKSNYWPVGQNYLKLNFNKVNNMLLS